MANPRDDMVIKIRATRRDEKPVRERAIQERHTANAKRRRGGMLRRVRSMRLARRMAAVRRGSRASKAARSAKAAAARGAANKSAMKGAGKVFGFAAIIMEAIIYAGQAARRLSGQSARFVAATDAHTLIGDLDEIATATANARGFIESNGNLLRIIAQQGKVNSQILRIANDMKTTALHRAMGSDLISRDPQFDSADTLVDLLVKKAEEAGVFEAANRMIRQLQALGMYPGRIKTAR